MDRMPITIETDSDARLLASVPTYIRDVKSGEKVVASIKRLTIADLKAVDDAWKPYLNDRITRAEQKGVRWWRLPQHQNWDWASKINPNAAPDDYGIFGIECDGQIQGLMISNSSAVGSLIGALG